MASEAPSSSLDEADVHTLAATDASNADDVTADMANVKWPPSNGHRQGEELVLTDCDGRRWPRITKANAAQHPPPDLRKAKSRGSGSPPWCWYVQISGEAVWDQDSISYKRWKDKWAGWVGKNAARVEQRRESEQHRAAHAASTARSAAAEAQAASARLYTLPPDEAPHAAFFDARAADMAASLLAAIGADGGVDFCNMELGVERRLHEQLQLCPQLWEPVRARGDSEFFGLGPSGPRCTATRFPAGRDQHYCDGRAEAAAIDAEDQGVAPRVPPVSPLADDPFFATWNGPKLDWPGYTVSPRDDGRDVSEALAWDRRWHRMVYEWDDSRRGNLSVFAQLRPQGAEATLPPWLLIRRVLQILESRLEMGGRRLWWRSVFYAPPGFDSASDSRAHPTNAALISHMRLAGLGERVFTPRRWELLGKELEWLGGLPLERQFHNFTGWMGGRTWHATGDAFGPEHPLMQQRATPWWCPQRNVWFGQGCCTTCVLPPGFVLPYIPGAGKGSADNSHVRTEQAILKALLDLDARQRQLCGAHSLHNPEKASYDDFTCRKCAGWAKGPPSRWWRNYALTHWSEEDIRDDAGEVVGDVTGASNVNRFSKDKNWGHLGDAKVTTSFALALQDCDDRWGPELTSFAFAAPGFCPEHWQVGRATMTALGFRAVQAGEVHRFVQYPGGVAAVPGNELQQLQDEGHEPEAIPYARWQPAHGERAVREHLAARRADLQLHVHHALHEPDGRSRVNQLAQCILARPIPELPAQPIAQTGAAAGNIEVDQAMDALCVRCEESERG